MGLVQTLGRLALDVEPVKQARQLSFVINDQRTSPAFQLMGDDAHEVGHDRWPGTYVFLRGRSQPFVTGDLGRKPRTNGNWSMNLSRSTQSGRIIPPTLGRTESDDAFLRVDSSWLRFREIQNHWRSGGSNSKWQHFIQLAGGSCGGCCNQEGYGNHPGRYPGSNTVCFGDPDSNGAEFRRRRESCLSPGVARKVSPASSDSPRSLIIFRRSIIQSRSHANARRYPGPDPNGQDGVISTRPCSRQ